jgi:hypothetical protein
LAIVAALNDVLGLAGKNVAGKAGHEKSRKMKKPQLSMN